MSDRRIVIEIESRTMQTFTLYSATAKMVLDDGEIVAASPLYSAGTVEEAARGVVQRFSEVVSPPNAHFCHMPLACVLSGRCEKQFGQSGSACCE